jgi:hypothetical protein
MINFISLQMTEFLALVTAGLNCNLIHNTIGAPDAINLLLNDTEKDWKLMIFNNHVYLKSKTIWRNPDYLCWVKNPEVSYGFELTAEANVRIILTINNNRLEYIAIRTDFKRTEQEAATIADLLAIYKNDSGYDVHEEGDNRIIVYKMTPK